MLTEKHKLPAWIEAEVQILAGYTRSHNKEKLRERRENPRGVIVDIYHHSEGSELYFCDKRRCYFSMEEITEEANQKIACGQYLYSAILEYKAGVRFAGKHQPIMEVVS